MIPTWFSFSLDQFHSQLSSLHQAASRSHVCNVLQVLCSNTQAMCRTLLKTNIATENRPSQKETSIPTIHFQVLCKFQGGYESEKTRPLVFVEVQVVPGLEKKISSTTEGLQGARGLYVNVMKNIQTTL